MDTGFGSGSGIIPDPDLSDPKRPDPTGSGSATLLCRHRREAITRGNHVAVDLSGDLRGQVFIWEQVSTYRFQTKEIKQRGSSQQMSVRRTGLLKSGPTRNSRGGQGERKVNLFVSQLFA